MATAPRRCFDVHIDEQNLGISALKAGEVGMCEKIKSLTNPLS